MDTLGAVQNASSPPVIPERAQALLDEGASHISKISKSLVLQQHSAAFYCRPGHSSGAPTPRAGAVKGKVFDPTFAEVGPA